MHRLKSSNKPVDRDLAILLSDGERLVTRAASPGFTLDQDEYAVAIWAFQHGQPAGRGTDTLPAAEGRYLPLKTARGVVGVLGLKLAVPACIRRRSSGG